MHNSDIAYRANKTFFYQSGTVKHIEFDTSNPIHFQLLGLLVQLRKTKQSSERKPLQARANRLAKKVGFESYYNSDFGRWMLSSDLDVIKCDASGLINKWPLRT